MSNNSLTVVGRLVRDSELKFTADGKPVLNFTIASDVGWGDNKKAIFVGCSHWRKGNEGLHPYLKKGTQVTAWGECNLRLWEKNDKHGAEITLNIEHIIPVFDSGEGSDKPANADGFRDKPVTKDDFKDDDLPEGW